MRKRPRFDTPKSKRRPGSPNSNLESRISTLITATWLVFVVAMYLGFQIERLLRLFAAHR